MPMAPTQFIYQVASQASNPSLLLIEFNWDLYTAVDSLCLEIRACYSSGTYLRLTSISRD